MHAVVIYESLTGNTRRASELIAGLLRGAGHTATTCPVDAIDYEALHEAEVVIVGGWTDGLFFIGQRPGRAGRLRRIPTLAGKRVYAFITYAIDAGRTLEKLVAILEDRGAAVDGGMTIRRDRLVEGTADLVEGVLAATPSTA